MNLLYRIDSDLINVKIPNDAVFFSGDEICLSTHFKDACRGAEWYPGAGFSIVSYEEWVSYATLRHDITRLVREVLETEFPARNFANFELERYHKYVTADEHAGVVDSKIKRLYTENLSFDDSALIGAIESMTGVKLSYVPRGASSPHWIIVRVIMPSSTAYNPAHKDIYEGYDATGIPPSMVNCWIPVCGVNKGSGLGVVPGSHLIPENLVVRTKAGTEMNGNKFSVNCIKEWAGSNEVQTISPSCGEMLVFSSHLIHGLGRNCNPDITRVALEFRLHEVSG